ncbi:hypothetical protein [Chitinophaga sp.]|uniref:hypothetical protein n=1 Tax=Chitinophaga sp. TaxID=1869181 RepID=UPI002F920F41
MKKKTIYIAIIAITLFACQKETAKPSAVALNEVKSSALSKGSAIKDTELDKLMQNITGSPVSAQIDAIRRYADQKKLSTVKRNARVQTQSLTDDYPGLGEFWADYQTISLWQQLSLDPYTDQTFPLEWTVADNKSGYWKVKSTDKIVVRNRGNSLMPEVIDLEHNGSTAYSYIPIPVDFQELGYSLNPSSRPFYDCVASVRVFGEVGIGMFYVNIDNTCFITLCL